MALIITRTIYGKINTKLPFQGVSPNRHPIPRLRHRAELTRGFQPAKGIGAFV
jgi:hypothetical protein